MCWVKGQFSTVDSYVFRRFCQLPVDLSPTRASQRFPCLLVNMLYSYFRAQFQELKTSMFVVSHSLLRILQHQQQQQQQQPQPYNEKPQTGFVVQIVVTSVLLSFLLNHQRSYKVGPMDSITQRIYTSYL